jgi:hypothetical protein
MAVVIRNPDVSSSNPLFGSQCCHSVRFQRRRMVLPRAGRTHDDDCDGALLFDSKAFMTTLQK